MVVLSFFNAHLVRKNTERNVADKKDLLMTIIYFVELERFVFPSDACIGEKNAREDPRQNILKNMLKNL